MERRRETHEKPIVVVGNDVDLLVLIIGLTLADMTMNFYKITAAGKKEKSLYSTRDHKQLRPFIVFAHAFVGCDTTSAFYNKGKKTIITLFNKDAKLREAASVFYAPNKTAEELYVVAEEILKHFYTSQDKRSLSINELWHEMFVASVASGKKDLLSSLPPTDAALLEYVKRVYFQIQQWLCIQLDPLLWGRELSRDENTILIPTKTKLPAAPKELLKMVFCNCDRTKCTKRRRCRRAGIHCSSLCKKCPDEDSCSNLGPSVRNKASRKEMSPVDGMEDGEMEIGDQETDEEDEGENEKDAGVNEQFEDIQEDTEEVDTEEHTYEFDDEFDLGFEYY